MQEERNSALSEYRLVMSERDSVHKEMDKLQEDLLKAQEDGGKVKEDVERLVQEKEIVNHDLAIARSERDKVREGQGERGISRTDVGARPWNRGIESVKDKILLLISIYV